MFYDKIERNQLPPIILEAGMKILENGLSIKHSETMFVYAKYMKLLNEKDIAFHFPLYSIQRINYIVYSSTAISSHIIHI